jgi:hypothetical protein
MSKISQIQVGSLAVATRVSGLCDPGEVGVCYEVYQLAGRPGYRFLLESGRYDGFSPGELPMFLDLTGRVCELVADYQFQNVMKLTRDDRAGRFAAAFRSRPGEPSMRKLNGSPSLRRKMPTFDPGRQLVVILRACFLEVRPLGKRRGYVISYDAILQAAAEIEARKQWTVRQAEREARRKRRNS